MERGDIEGWVVVDGQAKVSTNGWDSGSLSRVQAGHAQSSRFHPQHCINWKCYPSTWVVEEGDQELRVVLGSLVN